MCSKESYDKYNTHLSVDDFDKELKPIYLCLQGYFNNNDNDLSITDLANIYFATRPKDREYAVALFDNLEKMQVQPQTTVELINAVRTSKLLRELSLLAYDSSEGRKDVRDVIARLDDLRGSVEKTSESDSLFDEEFVTDDLEFIVAHTLSKPGLRWRLATLNRMLGSLRKGDFGFVFARPETGKTTFLASEVTYMAEQLSESDGPILWLANEEQGSKVMLRCYQASLGIDTISLLRDVPGNRERFLKRTGGKIKMYDNASITKQWVEKACAHLKPSLIIIDQIDKIKGFDADREDLRLGAIYIWARELAKRYAPTMGICQADGTGENVRWLTMQHVANAKTSKQSEADFILGIGKVTDTGYDAIRFLHLSKNKLLGDKDTDPKDRHGRCEVMIQPEIARYGEIKNQR